MIYASPLIEKAFNLMQFLF